MTTTPLGLGVIAVFVTWVLIAAPRGHVIANPPGAAPIFKPPGQHY